MKIKAKSGWLITWEGSKSEQNGRCRIVTILAPQFGKKVIISMLPVLYSSECNLTLCEKMGFRILNKKDPFFKEAYRHINPEFWYGHFPDQYLRARKVKNLICEESETDCLENTLEWTELPKFIPNPDFDPNGPLPDNPADLTKQVIGERKKATYLFKPAKR